MACLYGAVRPARVLFQVNSSSPIKAGVWPARPDPSGSGGAGRLGGAGRKRSARPSGVLKNTGCTLAVSDESCLVIKRFPSGEFDPGSERTLAAWLRHASRTSLFCRKVRQTSGERESTKQVTYPGHRDSPSKDGLIPDDASPRKG